MSAYVTIGKPSFLSSGGLAPPKMEGKPPGSVVSHIAIIRQVPLVWQQNYVLFQFRVFPSLFPNFLQRQALDALQCLPLTHVRGKICFVEASHRSPEQILKRFFLKRGYKLSTR